MALPNFDDIDMLMTDVRRARGMDEEEPSELAMPNVDPVIGEAVGSGTSGAGGSDPGPPVESMAPPKDVPPLPPPAAPPLPLPGAQGLGFSSGAGGNEKITTTSDPSTSRVKEDKETQKAEAAAVAARGALVAQTGAMNQALKDVKETEAQQAEAELFQEQKMLEEREAAAKQHAERLAELRAERDERRATMEKSANITSYWEDKSVPARLLGMLLTGASELSWSRNGGQGPSPFFQFLQREEMRDGQRKQRIHDVDRMRFEAAKGALKEGEEQRKIEMKDLDDTQAARRAVMLKEMSAIIKRSGVPAAQANLDRLTAEVAADQAAKDEEAARKDDIRVTTEGTKVSTKTGGAAAGDKPLPPDEIRKQTQLAQDKKATETASGLIRSAPKAWSEYQEIVGHQAHVEDVKSAPVIGGLAAPVLREVSGILPMRTWRVDVDTAIKDIKDPELRAQVTKIHSAIEKQVAADARAANPSGTVTDKDTNAARNRMALQSRTAEEIASALDESAAKMGETQANLQAARSPNPLTPEEEALLVELRRRHGR